MNDDLIEGAASAAAFTGLTRRKIYRLVEEGHLPCVRKGQRMFFRKSELRRAFAAEEHGPREAGLEREVILLGKRARVRIERRVRRSTQGAA